MKRRNRTQRQSNAIADAFDDLPDAAFFGVMDEFGIDLSSAAEDDQAEQRRRRGQGRARIKSANTHGVES